MTRQKFESRLAESWPAEDWCDVTVVAAVSGGADSVAMLRGLHAIRQAGAGRLVVAHFNHRLRGAESDADEAFVSELAERLMLPAEIGAAAAAGDSAVMISEEAARQARYEFLEKTARRVGARFVVTAHTADDQAETILLRIARGTGIAGLAGMRRARELCPGISLLRPLLSFRRADTLAYLRDLGQEFRTDASNADLRFARNRLRQEVLPLLANVTQADLVESLTRLGGLAEEAQAIVDRAVEQWLPSCCIVLDEGVVEVNMAPLHRIGRYVVRELFIAIWKKQGWPLQAMTLAKWEQLATLALAKPDGNSLAAFMLPGNIRAEKKGETVVLSRPSQVCP